jgi:hypothetical protein
MVVLFHAIMVSAKREERRGEGGKEKNKGRTE